MPAVPAVVVVVVVVPGAPVAEGMNAVMGVAPSPSFFFARLTGFCTPVAGNVSVVPCPLGVLRC